MIELHKDLLGNQADEGGYKFGVAVITVDILAVRQLVIAHFNYTFLRQSPRQVSMMVFHNF